MLDELKIQSPEFSGGYKDSKGQMVVVFDPTMERFCTTQCEFGFH